MQIWSYIFVDTDTDPDEIGHPPIRAWVERQAATEAAAEAWIEIQKEGEAEALTPLTWTVGKTESVAVIDDDRYFRVYSIDLIGGKW